MKIGVPIFLAIILLVSGCATPSYREALREKYICNKKEFPVSEDVLYQAVTKAMCSRAFVIEKEDRLEGFILSKRYFHKGNKNIVLALQAKIIPEGEDRSTLYMNAVETTEKLYVYDRTRFFLFIIPLPGGGGKEATTIKEGERMIEDKKFYKTLFSIVAKELKKIK
jgi:hypothetical protein